MEKYERAFTHGRVLLPDRYSQGKTRQGFSSASAENQFTHFKRFAAYELTEG
jgi:hypothetical protein